MVRSFALLVLGWVTLWLHYGDIMVTLGDIPKYLKYLQMMSFDVF